MKIFITYSLGSNLRGCYSIIEGETSEEVYKELNKINGAYAFSYEIEELEEMKEKWNLKEVSLQAQVMEC